MIHPDGQMNGKINDGPYYDAALTVLAIHELELEALEWYDSKSMRIDTHRHFRTGTVDITVHGLPDDIPVDVFEYLLDNAIKFTIKGQKGATVKAATRNWVIHYKRRASA